MGMTTNASATSAPTTFCIPCDQQVEYWVGEVAGTTTIRCYRHGGNTNGCLSGTIHQVTARGATR
jgi:hypothetical protein